MFLSTKQTYNLARFRKCLNLLCAPCCKGTRAHPYRETATLPNTSAISSPTRTRRRIPRIKPCMLIPLIRGTEGVNKSIILALSLFITLPAAAQTITITASGSGGDRDTARLGLQVDEGDTVTFRVEASPASGILAFRFSLIGSAANLTDLGQIRLSGATVGAVSGIPNRHNYNLDPAGGYVQNIIVPVSTDSTSEPDELLTGQIGSFINAATLASLTPPSPSSVTVTIRGTQDYDTNNNGLIDITTLAQLNAIRWDLDGNGDVSSGNAANYLRAFPSRDTSATGRMGCQLTDHDDDTSTPNQATCTGYELMNDLDFDENDDGQITAADAGYWNSGAGWNPISTFTATFSGNGHTIANLFINRSGTDFIGLFGGIGGSARIEALGLTAAEVTGRNVVGILAGQVDTNTMTVASFTTGQVSGETGVGGLVGSRDNSALNFTILACYSTAAVSSTRTDSSNIGGLIAVADRSTITASYAIGRVSGNSTSATRGLLSAFNLATITASYWDTETSGIPDDSDAFQPEGKTTAELQTPTDYTGIYADWNIDVDGGGNDNPWAFGANYQYPVLRYGRTQAQINAQFFLQIQEGDLRMLADVNQDLRIDAQDALLMYRTYLPGLRGAGVDADDQERANEWRRQGRAVGGDLNGDGRITEQDALIMYYAYEFEDLLDQSASLRQLLLNGVRGQMPDTDATYRELLRRANRLR